VTEAQDLVVTVDQGISIENRISKNIKTQTIWPGFFLAIFYSSGRLKLIHPTTSHIGKGGTMHDLVTVMASNGISGRELLSDEIFADFLLDDGKGEDSNFDPLNDFVPIELVLDDRLDPQEALIAIEELDENERQVAMSHAVVGARKVKLLCDNLDRLRTTYFGEKCRNA
jgi:hypothetical protein